MDNEQMMYQVNVGKYIHKTLTFLQQCPLITSTSLHKQRFKKTQTTNCSLRHKAK